MLRKLLAGALLAASAFAQSPSVVTEHHPDKPIKAERSATMREIGDAVEDVYRAVALPVQKTYRTEDGARCNGISLTTEVRAVNKAIFPTGPQFGVEAAIVQPSVVLSYRIGCSDTIAYGGLWMNVTSEKRLTGNPGPNENDYFGGLTMELGPGVMDVSFAKYTYHVPGWKAQHVVNGSYTYPSFLGTYVRLQGAWWHNDAETPGGETRDGIAILPSIARTWDVAETNAGTLSVTGNAHIDFGKDYPFDKAGKTVFTGVGATGSWQNGGSRFYVGVEAMKRLRGPNQGFFPVIEGGYTHTFNLQD